MKILSVDPGAVRFGYCILEEGNKGDPPKYIGSGFFGVEREEKEAYQKYRLRVIGVVVEEADRILQTFSPDIVVSEIVPAIGLGVNVQLQLAQTANAAFIAIAQDRGYKTEQIGATTVKKMVGGSAKATKVQIRNGCMALLPRLADREKQWNHVKADESDAVAVGLAWLGHEL